MFVFFGCFTERTAELHSTEFQSLQSFFAAARTWSRESWTGLSTLDASHHHKFPGFLMLSDAVSRSLGANY